MAATKDEITLRIGDRDVVVTHPSKLLIPDAKVRKLDLVNYYVAVAEGALRGAGGRPCVLVRYPDGIDGEFFFQKRAPAKRPEWLEIASIRFPSGRSADEVVPRHPADLAWMANLACLELHPHPVRADDLEHPDELRVDLDPVPGVEWPQIRQVARVVHEALADLGLTGWPKTSGSRGLHVLVRIERRWSFDQVRRAALALARDVERRAPGLATSAWWKEERRGVFIDYNQNAKDRTVSSAYSVRPKPDARVSTPVSWHGARRLRPRRLHAVDRAEALAGDRRPARGDRHEGRLAGAAARAVGAPRGRWPWRCAMAAALPQGGRRAEARTAVDGTPRRAADRDRACRPRGRRDRRRRGVEGAPSAGRRAPRSRRTCWSTGCAAARRCGTACGST